MEGWSSFCWMGLWTMLLLLLALLFLKPSGGGNKQQQQLPPGPWTLPIIGSMHHLVSGLPHRRMMELSRRHGPLMLLRLGEVPTLVVSSAEAASLVMKTNDVVFASRPRSATQNIFGCGGKGLLLAPYGDPWRQMRRLCIVEILSSQQVRRMEGIRAEEVGNLLRTIAAAASAGATINVGHKVTALSNDIVTWAVFGGKFAQQEEYLRELEQAFTLLGAFYLVDLFPSSRLVRCLSNGERRMKRSYGRIQQIITDIIVQRRRKGAPGDEDEDLLDVLLRLQKEDSLAIPLNQETIGAVLFDIFAAATETTGSVLEWAMSELVGHPKAMLKAQEEVRKALGDDRAVITNSDLAQLRYMRMVIKEVLRLHPPGVLIPRMTTHDCKVMGYDILNGTNVFINIFAISRDPKYWKNPEEFCPERFETNLDYNGTNFQFTPFGAGRRQCPGIQFSSSVIEIVLANLLYHFDWMLPDGTTLASFDMSEKFTLTVGRKYDLQLKAVPYLGSKVMSSK